MKDTEKTTGRPQGIGPEEKPVWVNIAEMAVSTNPAEVLIAHGVGSCVICCIYDRIAPVAGMVHIMLPVLTDNHRRTDDAAGYADVGIPMLIAAMRERGALETRMIVKLAGGASVVKTEACVDRDIGRRNFSEARRIIKKRGLQIVFEDSGGTSWRNVHFYTATGRLVVTGGRRAEKVCDINSLRAHRISKS
jgi:chemotaxis protein CheD